jgi:hypothetical protein
MERVGRTLLSVAVDFDRVSHQLLCHSDRSWSASDNKVQEPAFGLHNRGRAALQRRVSVPKDVGFSP